MSCDDAVRPLRSMSSGYSRSQCLDVAMLSTHPWHAHAARASSKSVALSLRHAHLLAEHGQQDECLCEVRD